MSARMFFGRYVASTPVTVTLNSAIASGSFTNSPPGLTPSTRSVNTNPNTVATPAGGSGSYTYSWTRISGSTAITATASTSASTAFVATVGINQTLDAVFRVTVTDTLGATATADVSVDLSYFSGL